VTNARESTLQRQWLINSPKRILSQIYLDPTHNGYHSALHQKSGQYADLSVNKTFLASF
jgi:hypothetical protein